MQSIRRSRILATLGPQSSTYPTINALVDAGANAFRLNLSHGEHRDHQKRYEIIRRIEAERGYPIGVLMDLQGPKLRVGSFAEGEVNLQEGASFRLDTDTAKGNQKRVNLPHPEVYASLSVGTRILLDDGKLKLEVRQMGNDFIDTIVKVGGVLSNHKGVNIPDVTLKLSPLTAKDREDLAFGLKLGVDWVGLSFVQRAEDIQEARELIGDKAWIMAKLEKPAAIKHLDAIIDAADGVMVARGDLGVEMPAERVPVLQRDIVSRARAAGKPVVIATQMLESMIDEPVATRAETSDVATAIYGGADAIMLSAESAAGKYPVEAVATMRAIIHAVEADGLWQERMDKGFGQSEKTIPDAICAGLRDVARILQPAVTVAYTTSGSSALRAARERPVAPIFALTPTQSIARRLTLGWGILPKHFPRQLTSFDAIVASATDSVKTAQLAKEGDIVVIIAGQPFGYRGSTNILHITHVQ